MADASDSASDSTAEEADLETSVAPGSPPAVVAVVVTHDPGPFFAEALLSLRDQEYPALSVLVVDAASADDPTGAIASVIPSAFVRRLDVNPGFSVAANEVLHVVEGAAFYVFCHDDVVLAPDAVRAMVEEAFRSNAGMVAPKVVAWNDPSRILTVGETTDKTGVRAPLVERGELDQEQYDAVTDVFVAPGGCTLVRADLFAVLNGFDPAIDFLGEDLDLSWRAQVVGARVIAAPSALVRHLEAGHSVRPIDNARERTVRHRLRTMLTCYGPWHRARVVPQAFALTLIEVVYALVAGRRDVARDLVHAWRWNFARREEIKSNRAALAAIRQLPDSEVRRLQVRGWARLSAFLRGQLGIHGEDDRLQTVTSAGRDLAGSIRSGPLRTPVAVWVAVLTVLLFGTRQLFFGKLPALADLPEFPTRPWTLFTEWFSGWRNAGLGSESPAPTAFAMLGSLGVAFLGAMSLLRRVLFLAAFPVGVVGMWRLTRPFRSSNARLVGLVAFLAIPLPYNAIARGRWGGLVLWAAMPWIVGVLARQTDVEPFSRRGPHRRTVLGFGLVVAVLAAFVPFTVFAIVVVAVGLAIGGLLAARVQGGARAISTAVGAGVVAFVLHLPWTLDFVLPGSQWSSIGGVKSDGAPLGIGDLIRFHAGPWGGGPIGLAFLVAAALPLVIGSEWRFVWAAKAWALAITCWTAAWVGQQSWFHFALGPPEALLAPASVALALSAALGVVAFEVDLRGYRFGWRQVASVTAAAALALGTLPVIGAMFDGRWKAPDQSYGPVLSFLDQEQSAAGPFRVVWIGDPDALPLAGWQLRDGVAYATTDQGLPTVENRWPGTSDGDTSLVADAINLAQRRDTSRLGRLVAPMGVRYFIVAGENAPSSGDVRPLPSDVERGLSEQLDLQQILADPHLHVYRNVSWAPIRTELKDAAVDASKRSTFFDAAATTDLSGSPAVLTDHSGYASAKGAVNAGSTIYLANDSSPHWSLSVDGHDATRSKAFGWANSFQVDQAGTASLRFNTPVSRYALLLIQVGLWVFAIRRWRRWRDADPGVRADN